MLISQPSLEPGSDPLQLCLPLNLIALFLSASDAEELLYYFTYTNKVAPNLILYFVYSYLFYPWKCNIVSVCVCVCVCVYVLVCVHYVYMCLSMCVCLMCVCVCVTGGGREVGADRGGSLPLSDHPVHSAAPPAVQQPCWHLQLDHHHHLPSAISGCPLCWWANSSPGSHRMGRWWWAGCILWIPANRWQLEDGSEGGSQCWIGWAEGRHSGTLAACDSSVAGQRPADFNSVSWRYSSEFVHHSFPSFLEPGMYEINSWLRSWFHGLFILHSLALHFGRSDIVPILQCSYHTHIVCLHMFYYHVHFVIFRWKSRTKMRHQSVLCLAILTSRHLMDGKPYSDLPQVVICTQRHL